MDSHYSQEMLEKFDKFKKGSFLIFRKWAAFRMALDNNPELLTVYYDDEKTELEVYYMLRVLLSEVDDEISTGNSKIVTNFVAEILFDFIQEYFHLEIEDNSEKLVARDLVILHCQIFKDDKDELYENLKKEDKIFKGNYSVDFPITKKSVMNKILTDKMEKMEIDDGISSGSEVDGEDNKDKSIKGKEEKNNIKGNGKIKDLNIPDQDGFVEVKKKKKMDKTNKYENSDVAMEINVEGNMIIQSNVQDSEGFVEVKGKKKK